MSLNNLTRCFIAIPIPSQIRDEIAVYLNKLKEIAPEVRWVKPTGIHITLKFLAEQPDDMVNRIAQELEAAGEVCRSFQLVITGAGCFPNARKPRVFWLGLEHDQDNSLFILHDWIDKCLEPLGFEREKRRFSPHLTIGRVKISSDYQSIIEYYTKNPFPRMNFAVDELILMKSELRPQGAIYTPIKTFLL